MFTGRGVLFAKTTVDDARALDMVDLRKAGFFRPGAGGMWKLTWRRGETVMAKVGCYRRLYYGEPVIRFLYSITHASTGEEECLDYMAHLETTPCYFGGYRWWFICPRCNERCRIIYLPPFAKKFACRDCHDLTYKSRQRHRDPWYEAGKCIGEYYRKALHKLSMARTERGRLRAIRKLERMDMVQGTMMEQLGIRP